MRPVSVRFKCFGPYMAVQFIDFAQLQENGLFLICGETGAGKTTILDAICYALYGRSSGGLRGDLSVMRCKLAGREDETLVEFIFDSNGKRYKFTRSLKYGRKNLNDSHNCLVLEDGEYVPIFENPKATFVNQKAQELIGLTYDQFRQVIILPQGQFEKLLVSDSAEKEKILVSLFHADRWQRIAEELHRRVAEQDTALKQEKAKIAGKLQEYGCASLPQLEEARTVRTQTLEDLTGQLAEAEKALTLCRSRKEEALLEDKAFQELTQAEKTLSDLEKQTQAYLAEEALLAQADKAEAIRADYQAHRQAEAARLRAQGLADLAQTILTTATQALTEAEAARQAHEDARQAQEERTCQLTLLASARPLYAQLKDRESAAKTAKSALTAAKTAQKKAEESFALRDGNWRTASLAQKQSIEDYLAAQAAYHRSIGSILAERLTVGEPCPVCGSREHPAPAQPGEENILDKYDNKVIWLSNKNAVEEIIKSV